LPDGRVLIPSPLEFYSGFKSWDVIKAVRLRKDTTAEELSLAKANSEFLLFDSFSESEYGGTGEPISAEVLSLAKDYLPEAFLAGGITPENAAEKIALYKPYAIDLASGVESSAGKKSAEKLKVLFGEVSS